MKKGVALIWVLVLSTVLMLMSTMMVDIIVKEAKFGANILDSTKAYLAAESGINWAKEYCITGCGAINDTNPFPLKTLNVDGLEVKVNIVKTSLTEEKYLITSAASSNGVNRKIEYKKNFANPTLATCTVSTPVLSGLNLSGSFEVAFLTKVVPGSTSNILFKDSTGNGFLVSYNPSGQLSLYLKNSTTYTRVGLAQNVTNYESFNSALFSRIKLKYIDKTNMGVYLEKIQDDGSFQCIYSTVFNLTGSNINWGALNSVVLNSSAAVSTSAVNTCSPEYKIKLGAQEVYNLYRID